MRLKLIRRLRGATVVRRHVQHHRLLQYEILLEQAAGNVERQAVVVQCSRAAAQHVLRNVDEGTRLELP
eukprot:530633-Prymnesium_polylepis.1